MIEQSRRSLAAALDEQAPLRVQETGRVNSVGQGVAIVDGLPGVKAQELIGFAGGAVGIAFNLDADALGVVLLDTGRGLAAGAEARRSGRVVDIPVGKALLGRVIDALGRPLDEAGPLPALERWPVEREAPAILERAPVTRPLETGVKAIDALVPIGRGQRELILGDRQTGKTSVAVDTIVNQRDKGLICVYCAIGQRSTAVAKVVATLRAESAMEHTVVVVAAGENPPGLQFITPYAATSIADYFMAAGHDVLIVYDDLTRHANAYRELSLLLRRPPGREAYPGDIFYLHSRLLERATQLRADKGGGSLTALPIIETEAQNIAAYIPTNLVSITDGQVYLSPDLAHKGILPAVDVGKSVSRVGGKAQLPAFRSLTGELRLSYAQFEELETFARFGTRLDATTQHSIERGRRVREVLKQAEHAPLSSCEQVVVLLAVTRGVFDDIALEKMAAAEQRIRWAVADQLADICRAIAAGERLDSGMEAMIVQAARSALGLPPTAARAR
jgi:F-type H+-transporting ATPase subunit alpha